MIRTLFALSGILSLLLWRATGGELPAIQTVFIIQLENTSWPEITGSTNAPFITNVLLPLAARCDKYYNPADHLCSFFSYLWLEAGTDFSLDITNCYVSPAALHFDTTNHFVSLLERAGISWKSYQEAISGTVVPLQDSYPYAVRHNPFVYFDDITGTNNPDYAYGIAHIRPYSEFAGDLANGTIARCNFLKPGVCTDMHDTCPPYTNRVRQGDMWLAQEIPRIMSSPAYLNDGAIFVLYDELAGLHLPMPMLVLSPLVRAPGYASTNYYDHSSTLRTFQDIFGVRPYLGAAATATNLSELFSVPFRILRIEAGENSYPLFTVGGVNTNANLILETSTDLLAWTPCLTNQPTVSPVTIPVPEQPQGNHRFYRFIQPGGG